MTVNARPWPSRYVVWYAALGIWLLAATSASALDVQVKDFRAPGRTLSVTIELRDLLPDHLKKTIDDGGVLYLRLQADLWESRPVWDRLVYPAIVRVFRFAKAEAAGRGVSVTDPAGDTMSYATVPNAMPISLEIGSADRIEAAPRYYLHVVVTLGTLAQRQIDDMGDAVFGRAAESNTLGALGRAMFRKVLEIGDYLQSVSAETRSRKLAGSDLLKK